MSRRPRESPFAVDFPEGHEIDHLCSGQARMRCGSGPRYYRHGAPETMIRPLPPVLRDPDRVPDLPGFHLRNSAKIITLLARSLGP